MRDPRDYIEEIQQNLRKLQLQGTVTPNENALFGMIDGLAGLQRLTMERLTVLEQALQGKTAEAARRRHDLIEAMAPDRAEAPVRDATPNAAPQHGR